MHGVFYVEFIKTKDGTVVGFYEAPRVQGVTDYVATVFPRYKQPWSVLVADPPSQALAELVVQRYKETIDGKESKEPR
jgi:hypothetical protein